MAGRPKTRNMKSEIARLAKEAGQADPLEYILGRLEGGEMVYQVAADVGGSETMLRRWCYSQPEGRRKWQEAMTERSHSLVEQSVQIVRELKGTEVTKEEIALAKLETDQLNLIAKAHNRPVYGNDAPQVNVQVNMGQLHLDALRQVRVVPEIRSTPLLPAGEEVDAEIVA